MEAAIAALDAFDGDPDLEPCCDDDFVDEREPENDGELTVAWLEDQRFIAAWGGPHRLA